MKNKKSGSKNILENLSRLINESYVPVKLNYEEETDDMGKLYGKHPKCFHKIKAGVGQDFKTYLLPLCNRAGLQDKSVIDYSLKVVSKLIEEDDSEFDVNELNTALALLQHKKNTLSHVVSVNKMGEEQFKNQVLSKALDYFNLKN